MESSPLFYPGSVIKAVGRHSKTSGVSTHKEVGRPLRPQEDDRARTPDLPARPCGDGTFPGDVTIPWRQWSSSIPVGQVWCNSGITRIARSN